MSPILHPRRPASFGRRGWILATLLLAALVGACGTAAGPSADPSPTRLVVSGPNRTLPPCAGDVSVAVPTSFPVEVPLPPGAHTQSVEPGADGSITVVLVAPMGIKELGAWLEAAIPGAGLTLGEGEAEPDELEQSFSGEGLAGTVIAHGVADCEDAVTVRVAVRIR